MTQPGAPTGPAPVSRASPGAVALRCAVLIGVTLAAYFPALRGGFLWDDDAHVTRTDLRSLHGLWRIWFELGATQQYYPVLHSAFWLEHRLWGDATLGYHLVNVLLHAAAACLFAAVLRRLSVPGAWFGALLFALHPVCVESVAWISEQKNTLSAVFYLLAALAYLRFVAGVGDPGGRPQRGRLQYLLATLLFVLALLSKSVTATLPAALLVVIWWKRGRLEWRRDVVPLLPWFVIGAGAGLFTAWVERRYVGAAGADFDLSLLERAELAGRVVWFYLEKLAWPSDLIFIYPRWNVAAWGLRQILYPLGACAVVAGCWLIRRRTRAPLAAALIFVGTLFPALGFFNVYPFLFSYVADHFQYLASLGLIALAAGAWGRATGAAGARAAIATVILCVLGVGTWRQCRNYRDAQTLYQATLDRNPDCWLAHLNLGNLLLAQGRAADAISHYRTAERLEPDYPSTHFNLGKVLLQQGLWPEAGEEFAWTLRLNPGDAEACNNLGVSLANSGRWEDARVRFEQALRLRPDYPVARANLDHVEALQRARQSP